MKIFSKKWKIYSILTKGEEKFLDESYTKKGAKKIVENFKAEDKIVFGADIYYNYIIKKETNNKIKKIIYIK